MVLKTKLQTRPLPFHKRYIQSIQVLNLQVHARCTAQPPTILRKCFWIMPSFPSNERKALIFRMTMCLSSRCNHVDVVPHSLVLSSRCFTPYMSNISFKFLAFCFFNYVTKRCQSSFPGPHVLRSRQNLAVAASLWSWPARAPRPKRAYRVQWPVSTDRSARAYGCRCRVGRVYGVRPVQRRRRSVGGREMLQERAWMLVEVI